EGQRERRSDRARPSDRSERSPRPGHAPARDAGARRRARRRLPVHRRRAGNRDARRAVIGRGSVSAAAFFDIDGTLLSVNTAPLYARYLRRHGRARRRDLVRTAYYLLQYRLNLLDIDRALERASRMIVGQLESDVAAFCERWYEDMVRAYLVPGMTRVMDEHRAAGHEIALLSSSTSYL